MLRELSQRFLIFMMNSSFKSIFLLRFYCLLLFFLWYSGKTFAQCKVDVEQLALGTSYTSDVYDGFDEVLVEYNFAKSQSLEDGNKAVCLSSDTSSFVRFSFEGLAIVSLSFQWEQEYSSVTDAYVSVNGEAVEMLKSSGTADSSFLFSYELSIPIQTIEIRQNSMGAGQISIGDFLYECEIITSSDYKYGDVLISEYMVDPTPAVYLPECEYVELYNSTKKDINLNGWTLLVNNSEVDLPNYILKSNATVVLVDDCDGEYSTEVLSVDLPALSNSYCEFALLAFDQLIFTTVYDSKSFAGNVKSDGGWSIEKHNCKSDFNADFHFSESEKGGSPGEVSFLEFELESLSLVAIENQENGLFELEFSQTIDSSSVFEMSINDETCELVEWKSYQYRNAFVKCPTGVVGHEQYEICVSGVQTYTNVLLDTCFTHGKTSIAHKGDVIVTELLPDPRTGDSEYIEVQNVSNKLLNLSELQFAIRNDQGEITTVYPLSETNQILYPNDILVFAESTITGYVCFCEENMKEVDDLPALTNSGGTVLLVNKSLEIVDEVTYSETMFHESFNDYSGVALELIEGEFVSGVASCGYGSPGCENSNNELSNNEVLIVSEYVTFPKEVLEVQVNVENETVIDLSIFNEKGQFIYTLTEKELTRGSSFYEWSGDSESGNEVPAGIFVLVLQQFDGGKLISTTKRPFVILR